MQAYAPPAFTTAVTLTSRLQDGQEVTRREVFAGRPTHDEIVDRFSRDARPRTPSPVPSPPVPLWDLFPDAVPAIHVMHKRLSDENAQRMVPALLQRCAAYQTTPTEVLQTLGALQGIHRRGNQSTRFSSATRERVLAATLDMYGSAVLRTPQQQIAEARKVAWTRIIEFSGDVALTALGTTSFTATAACATYMAGAYAGAQLAAVKTAATTGAAAKAGALGGAAAVGSAAMGVVTAGVGLYSVAWWMSTIHAFRDVWDNDFARDAWFFHKMRDHHVLPDNNRFLSMCNHSNGDWTSMNNEGIARRIGLGHN